MTLAQRIRQHVLDDLITPARNSGQKQVTIWAKNIHAHLELDSRFPAVCDALDADLFLDEVRVTLIERRGPKQSSTVEWVLGL